MRDFREFLMRGKVVDLAVAVIIGGAFNVVIPSFIGDIITPLLLSSALKAAGVEEIANFSANGIKYGLFLSAVINFVVIAFVIFLMIRASGKAKRKEEVEEAAAESSIDEKFNETLTQLTSVIERKL
jgi:large conductance mechanosensitive channel